MIEELEKTESTWSRLPIAGRNKAMLQKWKKELKVSTLLTYSLLKAYKRLKFSKKVQFRKYLFYYKCHNLYFFNKSVVYYLFMALFPLLAEKYLRFVLCNF